jgi:hypothetical protein
MVKPLECILSDIIHTLLGDITLSPSKVLDTVIDVILPELHQYLLGVFLICSNSLGKGPSQAGLKMLL